MAELDSWIKKEGNSKVNNHKTLKYLSEVFGVSYSDLLEWKENKGRLPHSFGKRKKDNNNS